MSISVLTTSWATYALGSFWVLNNVWGAGSLVNGTDYSQSISIEATTFPGGVSMSWKWPRRKSVLAYPEIVYGMQQGGSFPAPGGAIMPPPAQVANFNNLSAQYSFSMSGQTRNFDIAFDLWLTSQEGDGKSTIKDELLILVHNPWSVPGSHTGTVNKFGIYVSSDWGDSAKKWTLVELVPAADTLSGTISFSDILKTLIWDGVLTGSEYISGIELGAEVGGGAGSFTINNLSYQWIANANIEGTAGDDTLNIAATGGNHVVGHGGADKVAYNGAYSQFQIKGSESALLVTQNNNISTLDVLNGVSYIEFSDGTYDAATAAFSPAGHGDVPRAK